MSINSVVTVNVNRQTRPTPQAGFGIPLVLNLGTTPAILNDGSVKSYTSTDSYSKDFGSDSEITKALNILFGQTAVPERVIVGSKGSGETATQALDRIYDKNDGFYVVCPIGNDSPDPNTAQIKELLEINDWVTGKSKMVVYQDIDTQELSDDSTVLDPITPVTISLSGAASSTSLGNAFNDADGRPLTGDLVGFSNVIGTFTAKGGGVPPELGDDIKIITDKFIGFGSVTDKRVSKIEYVDSGATKTINVSPTELNRTIGGEVTIIQFYPSATTLPGSGDWANLNLTFADGSTVPIDTLGSELKNRSSDRSAVFWTENATDYINLAVVGRCFPLPVGSLTFAYKTLNNVKISPMVTTGAVTNLKNKNINYYLTIGGRNVTLNGVTSGGEYIDIIRTTDWLSTRIQENVFTYIANAEKIPYTDEGADILVNAATEILDQAVLRGAIAENYTVSRQSVLDVPINDRANRKFPDIKINARVVGAIHMVEYNLTITV